MNVALVNPIAATPAYTTRDFILRPTLPGLTADTGQLRETNLVELGSELSKRGHRVTVFFGDMYLDGREHDLGDRLRVVPLPTRLRTPFHPGLVPVTPDLLRHPALREADVIQASEFHQPSTFFASLVARECSVPLVVWQETFRRMRFPGSAYQMAFESAVGGSVRKAGRGFVPRTTKAQSFLHALGVEDGQVTRWIPTGIDTDTYAPTRTTPSSRDLEWNDDERVLLLVGRLHRSKGVDFALHTLQWLLRREPKVRLAIRGSGPELGALRRLTTHLRIREAVRFLDRLSRKEMVDLYNRSEIVLCTSENDLLPFTLIEASACGRPCVTTEVGAVRDIVSDGVTGVVVRERTVPAFGEAVLSLLRDPERQVAYGCAARARALDHFALPIVATHLLEVYDGVAG
ncbi:MAG TPA: glycosyltransferase family 4 protein [Thermoplasmata archaeon]|nr:glycosyltransferase family 4 protein [Thermoplasmata archaeon]